MPNKIPEKLLNTLWTVFSTFFSMKDIEKELSQEVRVVLCGDSPNVDELFKLMDKETDPDDSTAKSKVSDALIKVGYPPSSEETDIIIKAHVTVFILDEKKLDANIIKKLGESLSCFDSQEKKHIWFIDGKVDEMRKDEIKDIFDEISVSDLHWLDTEWKNLPKCVLASVKDKSLSFAREIPFLRNRMAVTLIKKTSMENTYIAFASSLPANIPVIGIIIGFIAVAGETLFITANQIRMCLRIAGIYGNKADFFSRMGELWPVLAGAFGWRALARTLTGVIPGGGPVIKAPIAYAGTNAVGYAALWYYRDGRKLSKEEIQDLINSRLKGKFIDNLNNLLKKSKDESTIDDEPDLKI